ncbi:hypothetical protein G163CM_10230 [Pseudocitrobacter corydidari]|uniref:Uncharacterized protein n=2 Tax=Pseudocitrobacter corydidari TaxID=2891570 RepID=A0ABY3S3B3_9ENTR|nr:hypothetical protein G163CM_10230 [Pseudocitrobacter corydidari]
MEISEDVACIDNLEMLLFFKFDIFLKNIFKKLAGKVDEIYDKYEPITLHMVEESIRKGRWVNFIG